MMFLALPPVVTSGAHALTGDPPPPPVPELLDVDEAEEEEEDELSAVEALEEELLEAEVLAPPLPAPGSEEQPTQRHVEARDNQAAWSRVERAIMDRPP